MAPKALVIDDDPEILEDVAEILDSMGHEYDLAACQEEGRRLVAANEYTYFLLDLEIPVAPGKKARIQNGENLLREILDRHGLFGPPVIVITGHGKDGPGLARRMFHEGAIDFVNKPFPSTGDTLDKAIRKAISRQARRRAMGQHPLASPAPTPANGKRFRGGEMVFADDGVRLCGVKIISDKGTCRSIGILRQLRQKDANGRFVRLSAEELAQAIGAVGIGTVTSCIATLRRNAARRLQDQLGIECGPEGVIAHDEQGYYLREWIRVRGADESPCQDADTDSALWNRRQRWVIAQLKRGVRVQRKMLQGHFRVGEKTAKRDLTELRKRGEIKFVRGPDGGYYELAEACVGA